MPTSKTKSLDLLADLETKARAKKINSLSSTITKMNEDVEKGSVELQKYANKSEIRELSTATTKILEKLSQTVGALSTGVKTISLSTAKVTKETIQQYGKAISEDISFNKQSVVAMALARSTPLFGYFAAKFMETDVFRRAKERMKSELATVFTNLGSKIKSWFTRKEKDVYTSARESRASPKGARVIKDYDKLVSEKLKNIPAMQVGGLVTQAGLVKAHAGEIVAPISKVLKDIDEGRTYTSKVLGKLAEGIHNISKFSLQTQNLIAEQLPKDRAGFLESIKRAWQLARHFQQPWYMRLLRAVMAIQTGLGLQLKNLSIFWNTFLWQHPGMREIIYASRAMGKAIGFPFKFLFHKRGGYFGDLPHGSNVLANTASTLGLIYTVGMPKLDKIISYTKSTAQATAVLAKAIAGADILVEDVPRKGWTIAGKLLRSIAFPIEWATKRLMQDKEMAEILTKKRGIGSLLPWRLRKEYRGAKEKITERERLVTKPSLIDIQMMLMAMMMGGGFPGGAIVPGEEGTIDAEWYETTPKIAGLLPGPAASKSRTWWSKIKQSWKQRRAVVDRGAFGRFEKVPFARETAVTARFFEAISKDIRISKIYQKDQLDIMKDHFKKYKKELRMTESIKDHLFWIRRKMPSKLFEIIMTIGSFIGNLASSLISSVSNLIGSSISAVGGGAMDLAKTLGGGALLLKVFGKKGAKKAAEKAATKGATKGLAKAAEKAATKGATKGLAKILGKGGLKVIAKKIPVLGAIAGGIFAASRLFKGDVVGAAGEMASGLASIFPGLGTAVSTAIDAGLIARDVAMDKSAAAKSSIAEKMHKASIGEYESFAKQVAAKFGIPEDLFLSQIKAESNWRQEARSKVGAIGLMQIMPATADELGIDPYNWKENIIGGAYYLKQQYQKFGTWDRALAAYNWGPGNVMKHLKTHGRLQISSLPGETRNYLSKITNSTGYQRVAKVGSEIYEKGAGYLTSGAEIAKGKASELGYVPKEIAEKIGKAFGYTAEEIGKFANVASSSFSSLTSNAQNSLAQISNYGMEGRIAQNEIDSTVNDILFGQLA